MASRSTTFLCFCVTLFLQGTHGEKSIADYIVEEAIHELVTPIQDIMQELKELLHEIEYSKVEIGDERQELSLKVNQLPERCRNEVVKYHSASLNSWSFDSCVSITDDLNNANDVIWVAGNLAWNITQQVATIGNNILNCAEWNPISAVKCYSTNLNNLKILITSLKTTTLPVVQKVKTSFYQVKTDFYRCVGIHTNDKTALQQHLNNCQ